MQWFYCRLVAASQRSERGRDFWMRKRNKKQWDAANMSTIMRVITAARFLLSWTTQKELAKLPFMSDVVIKETNVT